MVRGPFVLEELGNTGTHRGVARAGLVLWTVPTARVSLRAWLSQESWLPAPGGGGFGSEDGGRGVATLGGFGLFLWLCS